MKKIFYFLLLLCIGSLSIQAQGIYQLWGVGEFGGINNVGTIFSVNTTGDLFSVRHEFKISYPGANPEYSDLVEYNGRFYSMTKGGGDGQGVIFEWNPVTNEYLKKYSFLNDGHFPSGSLTLCSGKFYGMTEMGGSISNPGVIFEWDPATNVYTKKIVFNHPTGDRPKGSLTLYNGKLYGMTQQGGINNCGVIFEWDPATNLYTKKIDLTGSNGRQPLGNLVFSGGKFYGMTRLGGINDSGVIFEWHPATNMYTKRIDLDNANGNFPHGNLTEHDGKFYGMTSMGGSSNYGVIFEWDPVSNAYIKKIDLVEVNGTRPTGSLTLAAGKFYGMTKIGGTYGKGVLFEWDPVTNVFDRKKNFTGNDGILPYGSLTFKDGKFYGMTNGGGGGDLKGVIFEWDPVTDQYLKRIDLNGSSNGKNPCGELTLYGGKIYAVATAGGSNGEGVIFELDRSTNTFIKRKDFNSIDGIYPMNTLTLHNGKFYGMTNRGGIHNCGVIFEWDPVTNVYSKKIELNGLDGKFPHSNLTYYNGKFYGMTVEGGSNDKGVLFEWDPATNVYSKKMDMNEADGYCPYGSLVIHNDKLYGMAMYGGSHDKGVIFEWDPTGNIYTKKIDFDGAMGNYPFGDLTMYNGKFYGMTNGHEGQNGSTSKGVIFEWDPASNIYTKKHDFNGVDGRAPQGSLTLNHGKFYGLTAAGGNNEGGVIFEWDPASNIYIKKRDLDNTDGTLPRNDLALVPAPVATGIANNCISFLPVTIDNSNNNVWVPVVDDKGDAVAEIKANGNNLGIVNASMYINTGTVREDGSKRLYLDRNITLTPQQQPASPVDIRLYFKHSEYNALKNAVNSDDQPAGINSIEDVGVYKNDDACTESVGFIASPVAITARDAWESDHVFSTSVSSFSSFYFSGSAQGGPLPVTKLELTGRLVNNNGEINWKTTGEFNTASFDLERSTDGRMYTAISNIPAINNTGVHSYDYVDQNIVLLGVPFVYYRLKQKDLDNRFTYSAVVVLNTRNSSIVMLYPNPIEDKANVSISMNKTEQVRGRIIDNAGRVIKQQQWNLFAGSNSFTIDVSNLANGMYWLELIGETINERRQFVKQ